MMQFTAPTSLWFTHTAPTAWSFTLERSTEPPAVGVLVITDRGQDARWMVLEFNEYQTQAMGPLTPPFPAGVYSVGVELHAGEIFVTLPEPSALLPIVAAAAWLIRRVKDS